MFSDTLNKSFSECFTMPVDFLPKKKKIKLEKSGKTKVPAVGTSDEFWKMINEKQEAKKIKQEKAEKKKLLQEKKKTNS